MSLVLLRLLGMCARIPRVATVTPRVVYITPPISCSRRSQVTWPAATGSWLMYVLLSQKDEPLLLWGTQCGHWRQWLR